MTDDVRKGQAPGHLPRNEFSVRFHNGFRDPAFDAESAALGSALRGLANAGRMLDDNPGLLQLRILQQLGASSGNTIMLGVPGADGRVSAATASAGAGASTSTRGRGSARSTPED